MKNFSMFANEVLFVYFFAVPPPCGLPLDGDSFGGLLLLPVPEGLPVVLGILEGFGLPGFTVVFAIISMN